MGDESGACQTKNKSEYEEKEEGPVRSLDEGDIALLKTYGLGPYTAALKKTEEDIKKYQACTRLYVCVCVCIRRLIKHRVPELCIGCSKS
jgi:hypothetical protein